jgi:hypothetical protein
MCFIFFEQMLRYAMPRCAAMQVIVADIDHQSDTGLGSSKVLLPS